MAEGTSETVVPGPSVIGAPPGWSVCVPTTTADDGPTTTGTVPKLPTVCCCPGPTFCGSGKEVPPITIAVAEGASATGVPPTVTAGPPGLNVCKPTMTTDDGPTTTGAVPIVPTVCPTEG